MRFGTFSYNQARPWVPERQAFEELLKQIQLTERLGFDEAWFAEHHHSDYGMLASPNLIIAILSPPHTAAAPRQPGQCRAAPRPDAPRGGVRDPRYSHRRTAECGAGTWSAAR